MFNKTNPDFVISDINMPKMSGIDMARAIKEIKPDTTILLLTAFTELEYLMESISVGVDRYLTKPIKNDEFFEVLYILLMKMQNAKIAKLYEREKLKDKINHASIQAIKDTTNLYPNPTLIVDNNQKIYFINDPATQLFTNQCLKSLSFLKDINKCLVKKDGFSKSLSEINENDTKKIIWKNKEGFHEIFLVHAKKIDISNEPFYLYSLSDITRVEYEKQKSLHLSNYLNDLLRVEKRIVARKPATDETPVKESIYRSQIESMHPKHKESAKKYISQIDDDIVEEIHELTELENDMKECLLDLNDKFTLQKIQIFSNYLNEYTRTLSSLFEFQDLAFSLEKLSKFLYELEVINDEKKIFILLSSVLEDLIYWRDMIFVSQESEDIHYLDASLLSSCLQIEMDFGTNQDNDGDDLEIF